MKCSCPVFKYEAKGVRITYHRGRRQPYAVWVRAEAKYRGDPARKFFVHGFYATLEAVAEA